jgi:hypothetical protein
MAEAGLAYRDTLGAAGSIDGILGCLGYVLPADAELARSARPLSTARQPARPGTAPAGRRVEEAPPPLSRKKAIAARCALCVCCSPRDLSFFCRRPRAEPRTHRAEDIRLERKAVAEVQQAEQEAKFKQAKVKQAEAHRLTAIERTVVRRRPTRHPHPSIL